MAKTLVAGKVKGAYGTMYYVKDMAKSVSFYKDRLGLKPGFESPEWTEFPLAGLCLHEAKGAPTGLKGTQLILHVDGIRPLVAAMKAKGVQFEGDVHEVHPGAHAATFYDPDGNTVGLYEGPKSA